LEKISTQRITKSSKSCWKGEQAPSWEYSRWNLV